MTDPSFHLTTVAITAFQENIQARGTPDVYIRLGVKGSGGCSGYTYVIKYEDDSPKDTDIQFAFDGVCVVIDPKSMVYLNGCSLDFESSLLESRFVFNNPNADKQCSCGMSFGIKK